MTAALGLLVRLPLKGIVTVSLYRRVGADIVHSSGLPQQG